jgi:hypothetical protein
LPGIQLWESHIEILLENTGWLKSSMTREKMFRKSPGKTKNSKVYINLIKYRNLYNKFKSFINKISMPLN